MKEAIESGSIHNQTILSRVSNVLLVWSVDNTICQVMAVTLAAVMVVLFRISQINMISGSCRKEASMAS